MLHGKPRHADEHRDRDRAQSPSVFAAFLPLRVRKALTPFAIASTPVSAVEPDANARSMRKMRDRAAPRDRVRHVGLGACRHGALATPMPIRDEA